MSFPKRLTAAAAVAFAGFALFFYSWLAVAAVPTAQAYVPPVELALLQEPVSQDAFVQSSAAPAAVPAPRAAAGELPAMDLEPIANTIFYALTIGVVVWLLRPLVLRVSDWVGQRALAEEILTDRHISNLSKELSIQGLDLVLGRMGYTREDLRDIRLRNNAFGQVATFVKEQWPQVWKWVDQNQNGQIDWFESQAAAALPVVDHSKTTARPAPPAA